MITLEDVKKIFNKTDILVYTQKKSDISIISINENYEMNILYYNTSSKVIVDYEKSFKYIKDVLEYIRSIYFDNSLGFELLSTGKLLLSELYKNNLITKDEI